MEQIDYKFIDQVLADHACDASQIIAIMQDVQGKYRYLPKDALRYIADKVGISESKIYGVATFYENFSLDVKASTCSRSAAARRATCASPATSCRPSMTPPV